MRLIVPYMLPWLVVPLLAVALVVPALWSLWWSFTLPEFWSLIRHGRNGRAFSAYREWKQGQMKLAAAQMTKRVIWEPFFDHLTTYTPWHWRYWWRRVQRVTHG